jgi:glutaminyl-peptide cyclotransferase
MQPTPHILDTKENEVRNNIFHRGAKAVMRVPISFFSIGLSLVALGAPLPNKAKQISTARIVKALHRHTEEPHPMGSAAQLKYAHHLAKEFQKMGLRAVLQDFKAQTPSLSPNITNERKPHMKTVTGKNVVAILEGTARCGVLWGGHYDTKHFSLFRFVGANDGGSSTALLLELARVLSENRETPLKNEPLKWKHCNQLFVLFDGEEATLNDWNDGERLFGTPDNLYGSRHFANNLRNADGKWFHEKTPLSLVLVLDMIGHKNQKLSITRGSSSSAASQILKLKNNTRIEAASFELEDDHAPFAALKIPFVHIIDWENVHEWHTPYDTMEILSADKIAQFGNVLLEFTNADATP